MEDKHLEKILDEVKDATRLVLLRYKQTDDSNFLDVGIEVIEKCMKLMEESDKKSESIAEFYHTLRGMRDEMVDEKVRNSEIGRF